MLMGYRMSLSLRPEIRQQQRKLQLQILRAPTPPQAVCGVEGMRVADNLLKEIGVVGMLVGGLAKELWSGVSDEEKLLEHKDVDVILLSHDCNLHPKQWQSGIDWWVSHDREERPTNGNSVGLLWRVQLEAHARNIPKGLYLCPSEILRESLVIERRILRGYKIASARFKTTPASIYPVLDEMQIRWSWANLINPVARYC
ncbi:MAG TPA: hypothetical protein VJB58_03000 [Candidatus Paceibacterota bacterium]